VFLQVRELTFDAGDSFLGFLDGVERTLEPSLPASQCSAFVGETLTILLHIALAVVITLVDCDR
jgi:hypothetical protein